MNERLIEALKEQGYQETFEGSGEYWSGVHGDPFGFRVFVQLLGKPDYNDGMRREYLTEPVVTVGLSHQCDLWEITKTDDIEGAHERATEFSIEAQEAAGMVADLAVILRDHQEA